MIRDLIIGASLGTILISAASLGAQTPIQGPAQPSCEDQRDNAIKGSAQGTFEAAELRIQLRQAQERERAMAAKITQLETAAKAVQAPHTTPPAATR